MANSHLCRIDNNRSNQVFLQCIACNVKKYSLSLESTKLSTVLGHNVELCHTAVSCLQCRPLQQEQNIVLCCFARSSANKSKSLIIINAITVYKTIIGMQCDQARSRRILSPACSFINFNRRNLVFLQAHCFCAM